MSDKRFKVYKVIGSFQEWSIEDTTTDKVVFGSIMQKYEADRLCEKLNELNDEREQLKHDATVLINANKEYRKEIEDLKKSDSLVDLQDENKELKEQLKQCENLINDIRMGRIHDENKKEYFRLNGWKNE